MHQILKKGQTHYAKFELLLIDEIRNQRFLRFGSQTIQRAGTNLANMGLMVKNNGLWSITPAGMARDLTLAEAKDFVEARRKEEKELRSKRSRPGV